MKLQKLFLIVAKHKLDDTVERVVKFFFNRFLPVMHSRAITTYVFDSSDALSAYHRARARWKGVVVNLHCM